MSSRELTPARIALVDDGRVVGDEVDARDLLEDLVEVGEQHAVQVAVLVHGEEVPERAPGHLLDGVLHGEVLGLHGGVGEVRVLERRDDLRCRGR